jgi:hypothetical protein
MMVTVKLPIGGTTDHDTADKYVQFIAKRSRSGVWRIDDANNLKATNDTARQITKAYHAAVKRHAGYVPKYPADMEHSFDQAFLILQNVEDAVLAQTGSARPSILPRDHFSSVLKLLPPQYGEGLAAILQARISRDKAALPAKNPATTTAPPPSGRMN